MRRRIPAFLVTAALAVSAVVAVTGQPASAADVLQEVILAKAIATMGEPMSLAVLPDRTVLHTSRDGRIFSTDASGSTRLAGTIPVDTHDEEGLQGIAADPGFAGNRWIYLYYAPVYSTTNGDGGIDDINLTGTARYVRVNGTQRGLPPYGYSLCELEVYGG